MKNKNLGILGGRGYMSATVRYLAGIAILMVALPAAGSTNKAEWITEASGYILNNMDQVDAFMWFNNAKPGEPDWRIDNDPAAIDAYANAWHNGRTLQRGVFVDGAPPDLTKIDAFENLQGPVGPKVGHHDRVGWFETLSSPFPSAAVEAVQNRGSRPYIVWQPYDPSLGDNARGSESRLDDILANEYYSQIRDWALAAKDKGPIDMVFGHEMNMTGDINNVAGAAAFSWGYVPDGYYTNNPQPITDENQIGHNGNSPKMFKDAFKYVVNIFRQVGATNVNWIWDVNADWINTFEISFPDGTDPYLGLPYVDRMGMNGFNWGQRQRDPNDPKWDDWREFSDIFAAWGGFSTYQTLVDMNNLPIIIGEFGTNAPEPGTLALLALGGMAIGRRRRI
jgi:hypothetical protein